MALKTDEYPLNGDTFNTTQLPALRALRLFTRLVKLAGPLANALPEDITGTKVMALEELLKKIDVGKVLTSMAELLDPDDVEKIAIELLKNTVAIVFDADGKQRRYELASVEAINTVFTGRMRDMLAVMIRSAKVNFGDFIGGSAPSAAPLPAPGAP